MGMLPLVVSVPEKVTGPDVAIQNSVRMAVVEW